MAGPVASGLVLENRLPLRAIGAYVRAFAAFREREAPAGDWRSPDMPLPRMEAECLAGTNRERQAVAAPALAVDGDLVWIARYYAAQMAMGAPFDHSDIGGRHAMDRVGSLHRRLVGATAENLYANSLFDDQRPAAAGRLALDNLMQSPGHRRNLLDQHWTHAGFGAAVGGDGVVLVQLFVQRAVLLREPMQVQLAPGAAVPARSLEPAAGRFDGVAIVPLGRDPLAADFMTPDKAKAPSQAGAYRSFFAQAQESTPNTARFVIQPGPMIRVGAEA